ncbi:hypothetical protein [Bacillus pseudomycoides]|uniref:hypothetical protein n=1 Tax=Bacillus pseudomycoides TaxID=64104 RepID=UPI0009863B07|nr:hypothetical protein [Bacillus pseudomycoides]OOG91730.1 hypothetical protein BTH41_01324 [Bacillus mycoides]PEK62492.1 hypothetical protein CN590_21345 [Bacillus pseudomycoides]PEL25220.1 hypothetical protein CN608_15890 [Bacillus pseudomycoides]PGE88383.1 hypothetical protein COM55_02665 [Bacillus pseudomycoides]
MQLEQQDLFKGERVVMERKANAIIDFKDFGMKKIKYSPFRKHEAIGGKLYVTNYRLIFKSHPINRVRGMYSILLPTIQFVKDDSVLVGVLPHTHQAKILKYHAHQPNILEYPKTKILSHYSCL